LRTAIATGVLTVSYDGPPKRSVTYRSQAEQLQALAMAVREVNQTSPYSLAGTCKGV
jgi:hypothetical protein